MKLKEKIFLAIVGLVFVSGLLIYLWNYFQGRDLAVAPRFDFKIDWPDKSFESAQPNSLLLGKYFQLATEPASMDLITATFSEYFPILKIDFLTDDRDSIARLEFSPDQLTGEEKDAILQKYDDVVWFESSGSRLEP